MNRLSKYGLFIVAIGIFYSCLPLLPEEKKQDSLTSDVEINKEDLSFTTITIEGCEYLLLERDRNNPHEGFGFMAHKGNCSNSIHSYNK